MTYTSFNRAVATALLRPRFTVRSRGQYGGEAEAGGMFRPLNWDEFSRDVIAASQLSPVVYSLEGFLAHGLMPRFETTDGTQWPL